MTQNSSALRLSLMGLAGASIEWYDFLLYGTAAALVFPTVFFPAAMPPFVALIASFSTFAVGFIARPFGGVLFGHIGDRVGRKRALVAALLLMGFATTLIALLPSYDAAGVFSPLALITLRLAQGLAVGGQWGGATLLATESAPRSRRGLYGGIAQAGVFLGVLLANVAVLAASGLTTPQGFMNYGWRIPFIFSVVLIALGLFVHFRIEETEEFRKLLRSDSAATASLVTGATSEPPRAAQSAHKGRTPLLVAIRTCPGRMLLAAGVMLPLHAVFYVVVTYAIAYGTSASGLNLTRATMLGGVLIALVVAAPVCVLSGALSDRFGRRRLIMIGVVLMALSAFSFFPLIETRTFAWIAVALAMALSCNAVAYGSLGTMFAELFDTRMRYSAMSLAYQLGAIVGGGFVPIVATALYARFHTNVWMALYIMLTCVVAMICLSRVQETDPAELDPRLPIARI
jgi:MFS family permease